MRYTVEAWLLSSMKRISNQLANDIVAVMKVVASMEVRDKKGANLRRKARLIMNKLNNDDKGKIEREPVLFPR